MATIALKKPKKTCNDINCPFHGTIAVRGRVLEGTVVSSKMERTVIVKRDYLNYTSSFKRYERRRSHTPAHNPPCIGAHEGDRIKIAECRPVSKTVSFVVVQKMGEE